MTPRERSEYRRVLEAELARRCAPLLEWSGVQAPDPAEAELREALARLDREEKR